VATINLKVKFREGFRPFAPAVLAEHAADWFDMPSGLESPYMLLVTPVREDRRVAEAAGVGERAHRIERLKERRSQVPAITHVDYSARVQTVDGRHGRFRRLLEAFQRRTGCPAVINTSFNLGWDPIVESPRDAYATFMASDIDLLCLGNYVLSKEAQPVHVTSDERRSAAPLFELLQSPCHGAELSRTDSRLACSACGHAFPVDGGIPLLFWPHERFTDPADVTERVKAFYEKTPFPNYDQHESVRSLIEKSRQRVYAHALDRSIPYNSTVLEVGCGTGQLSNFLGISSRRVVGSDLCLNSLRLGEGFRASHGLDRVWFTQMNLFRPCFKPEQFDVILCNGVLHHTADPYGGFVGLLPLLKPGGHLVIGLYNTWGRLATDLRRAAFRLTRGRARWIDPILRRRADRDAKSEAWFSDQYRHPHESKHTMGEVLRWFEGNGLDFVRGVPSVTPTATRIDPQADLFAPVPAGDPIGRGFVQLREVIAGSSEGGFFIMIGRKRAAGALPARAVDPGTVHGRSEPGGDAAPARVARARLGSEA
jgi:2-polyprenyl-3-methyl-5-hydroxy-6-metoxy-1,4-benzoquinol methylase